MKKYFTYILMLIFLVVLVGCGGKKPIDPEEPSENPDETPLEGEYLHTPSEVLLLDEQNSYIELLNVKATKLTENTKVYKIVDGNVVDASLDDLFIGMENIFVRYINDEIDQILIDGDPIFPKIRVAIRNSITNISDESTIFHDFVTIHFPFETKIKAYDGSFEEIIPAGSIIKFISGQSGIGYYEGKILKLFDKRIIIEDTVGTFTVLSISRALGTPSYEGNLEMSLVGGRILLTNEIIMEDYLKNVVPSEMPTSWNMEALKSQAVAARTYAYREIYNKNFMNLGYVVDDSEYSQVYNNQAEHDRTNQAIRETMGITMFNNNEPIVAYYFSASSGLLAKGNEVWIENGIVEDIPYLQGGNLTTETVDFTDEDSILSFYRKLSLTAPSGNSSYFRWAVTMNKEQLRATLNHNLPLMIPGNEQSYPVLKDGVWVTSETFPTDIGAINNIFVSERGSSGVVMSLQIEAENITFRICNQYNIRFTIRPMNCGSDVVRYYTTGNSVSYKSSDKNPSILNSGFFALEWIGDELTFFGGGNGHGVGMCQYSANYYAGTGMIYTEILNVFYKNIEFVNTSNTYVPLENYEQFFK